MEQECQPKSISDLDRCGLRYQDQPWWNKDIADISGGELQLFLNSRMVIRRKEVKTKYSTQIRDVGGKGAADKERRMLRAIFNFAIKKNYALPGDKNPVNQTDVIRPEKQTPDALTDQDVEKLINVCKTQDEKDLIRLLANSGARSIEIFKLKFSDVDFESGRFILRSYKSKRDKVAERDLKYGVKTGKMLKRRFETWKSNPGNNIEGYVFWHRSVRPDSTVYEGPIVGKYKFLKGLAKRAGIDKNVTYHAFRRYLATKMSKKIGQNGTTIKDLQDTLGHKDFKTTMRYIQSTEARDNALQECEI